MNFAAIAFLDTFDLVASLPERIGLFRDHRLLPLRGPRSKDPDAEIGNSRELMRWPEVTGILDRIVDLGLAAGGVELGRVYLEMLMPGVTLPWTRDAEDGYERVHLALRTNPGAIVYCGAESLHILPGTLTLVARGQPVSAVNLGAWPRIHLIVEFRRT